VSDMDRDPFDPGDPMDAMAESFRLQVTQIALDAYKAAIYREMDPQQQLECFIAGALTGLVGVALASVKAEGADAIMSYFAACLPAARENAESIRDPNGSVLKNHHDSALTLGLTQDEPRGRTDHGSGSTGRVR
jgi:hypothetical protein